MYLLDLVNLDKLRRSILYALMLIVVMSVQELILSRVTIFGARAMIMPLFPIAVGMLQGGAWGMVFGLLCGILCDAMFSETLVLFTLIMPALGFLATAAERFLVTKRLPAFFAVSAAGLLATALVQALRVFLLYNGEVLPMLRTALLQTAYSLPFIFAIYFPCRALAERSLEG